MPQNGLAESVRVLARPLGRFRSCKDNAYGSGSRAAASPATAPRPEVRFACASLQSLDPEPEPRKSAPLCKASKAAHKPISQALIRRFCRGTLPRFDQKRDAPRADRAI